VTSSSDTSTSPPAKSGNCDAKRAKHKERQVRYWAKNRERLAAKKRRHYHKFRDKYLAIERERSYRKLYGITTADYDSMFAAQGGKCRICGTDKASSRNKAFAVDHDHSTGVVRGLLCIKCNWRLGWFEAHKDDVMRYLGGQ
jgi:hypothetical protein